MAKKTDSNLYTILFSIGMVVIVGALLAFFANFTKPMRVANNETKVKIDILASIGIEATRDNAATLFNESVKEQYEIIGTEATKNEKAYLIDVKKEQAKGKEAKAKKDDGIEVTKEEMQKLPLFIAEKEGKKIYIIPVRGNGLWDAIWGYVALNDDLKTIDGVFFDHKGETPGLGANITQDYFKSDFKGEWLYDQSGTFKGVKVSKTNGDPENKDKKDNEVDAIAGATITGNGVQAMLKSGIKVYLPYFETIKK